MKTYLELNCTLCSIPFSKLNSEVKRTKNHFCSKKCSNTFHRKHLIPNPLKPRICKICGQPFFMHKPHRSKTFCPICLETHGSGAVTEVKKNTTIAEFHLLPSVKGKHPSWINSHIRSLNRSWNNSLTKMPCVVCGYTLHVELCHKTPISKFPKDTVLRVVNHPDNIIPLCRNHHWELDHGYLKLS